MFFNSSSCGLVTQMVHAKCDPWFFEHSRATWLSSPQYKQILFIHQCCFSCSMKGLNLVLLIYMGSSFDEVAKGWIRIASKKIFYVAGGEIYFFVLSMWVSGIFLDNIWKVFCLTKQLVQWPELMLKGLEMWIIKSFTSPCKPN